MTLNSRNKGSTGGRVSQSTRKWSIQETALGFSASVLVTLRARWRTLQASGKLGSAGVSVAAPAKNQSWHGALGASTTSGDWCLRSRTTLVGMLLIARHGVGRDDCREACRGDRVARWRYHTYYCIISVSNIGAGEIAGRLHEAQGTFFLGLNSSVDVGAQKL